jgi:hypothetical protein
MVARGTVKGGVVVLEQDSGLKDGDEVAVVALRKLSSRIDPALIGKSMLDIVPVAVGGVLKPLTSDDDILGEMLDPST